MCQTQTRQTDVIDAGKLVSFAGGMYASDFPAPAYRVVAVRWAGRNAAVELLDLDTGGRPTAYLHADYLGQQVRRATVSVGGRPGDVPVRCAHCGSDNSGGVNPWTGSFGGSVCRCWGGEYGYEYLGTKPVQAFASR